MLFDLGYDQIATVDIPDFVIPDAVNFSLSIEGVKERGGKWAPYIYYSIYEVDDANSFRLFITQPSENEKLVAGAEYFKNGKNVFRKALITDIPFKSKISFGLSWNANGVVTYSVGDGPVQVLETGFKDFNAKVHASNAITKFYP